MNYAEQMQEIYHRYRRENHVPRDKVVDLHDVFTWAYEKKLWEPKRADMASQFVREMSPSLRQETEINESGDKVRVNFAVRKKDGDKQLRLWGDINMPLDDLERSCQQRRNGIVNVCCQLSNDVDHINRVRKPKVPIQIIWDFTDDVKEQKEIRKSA